MTKLLVLLTLSISLFAVEIPTSHAKNRKFGKSVELNAQVIQLSNAGLSVTSLVSGHLEKYFVEPGQKVKTGDKIALIESITISKMTADYISLKKQFNALKKNYDATKKLYDAGMTSMSEVNNKSIQKNAILAKLNGLQSQLNLLNIDTDKLKVASPNLVLYAHSSGKISELLLPLHTVVKVDEALITIVKSQAFYIKSFVPLKYAGSVKVGQKILVRYNDRDIITHVKQVLPSLDEVTQRIVVLSSVDEKANDLYINSFVKSTLYFEVTTLHVAVEKSALSFFNNEWVVFIEKDEHDEHGDEKHEEVNSEFHAESHEGSEVKSHEGAEHDDEHDEHGHEEHEEIPYEARVVKIVVKDDKFVGVKGLEIGEEYATDKSYYIKSMMLKSSLGEHGH